MEATCAASEAKRVAILALDGVYGKDAMLDTIARVMDGPMNPYMAYVKLNDGLHDRDGGPNVVDAILTKYDSLGVFGDIKGADVWGTIENLVKRYGKATARMLMTISIHVDHGVFVGLANTYPQLKVAAMVVPTDIKAATFERRYGMQPAEALKKWYTGVTELFREEIGGSSSYPSELVIASVDMLATVGENFPGVQAITPGVRDVWMVDPDHQKRTTGVRKALTAKARYVVMGAQLLKCATGVSVAESQRKTADELDAHFANVAFAGDDPPVGP